LITGEGVLKLSHGEIQDHLQGIERKWLIFLSKVRNRSEWKKKENERVRVKNQE
jgi:hypothetical protein